MYSYPQLVAGDTIVFILALLGDPILTVLQEWYIKIVCKKYMNVCAFYPFHIIKEVLAYYLKIRLLEFPILFQS